MSVSSNKRSPTLRCTCLTTSHMWQFEVGEEGRWRAQKKRLERREKEECKWSSRRYEMMTLLQLDGNHQSCPVLISLDLLYLVLYALTRLQAGKDLALNCLDPQLPLLICRCFKVPRLTRQRHNDELKGILLLWKTQMTNKWLLNAERKWLCCVVSGLWVNHCLSTC